MPFHGLRDEEPVPVRERYRPSVCPLRPIQCARAPAANIGVAGGCGAILLVHPLAAAPANAWFHLISLCQFPNEIAAGPATNPPRTYLIGLSVETKQPPPTRAQDSIPAIVGSAPFSRVSYDKHKLVESKPISATANFCARLVTKSRRRLGRLGGRKARSTRADACYGPYILLRGGVGPALAVLGVRGAKPGGWRHRGQRLRFGVGGGLYSSFQSSKRSRSESSISRRVTDSWSWVSLGAPPMAQS